MNFNEYTLDLGGGSLLQVANRTLTQMMSYVIETPEGGTVVIDGGNTFDEDADNLYFELKNRGGKVDTWFITTPIRTTAAPFSIFCAEMISI